MSSFREFSFRDYWKEILIFISALTLRVSYWAYKGTWAGGDAGAYRRACAIWAENPLGIVTAHKGIFYSGFTFPYCHVLSIPGATADWWVLIQITLSALGCVIVYRTGRRLMNETAGLFAAGGLVILYDTFLWTTLLYSTAMLTFAMICSLWAFSWYQDSGSLRAQAALLASFAFICVSHPFGAPIVLGWVLSDIMPLGSSRQIFSHRVIPTGVAVSSVGMLLYALDRYYLPARFYSGAVVYDGYAIPVQQASSFFEFIITNHIYAAAIPIARMTFFFAPFFPRNSTARIMVNLSTYTPILIIAIYGAYRTWTHRRDLFRYLVLPGIMSLALTAVYIVSWDLRYRAVLGPPMVLLMGYAVAEYIPKDILPKQLRS